MYSDTQILDPSTDGMLSDVITAAVALPLKARYCVKCKEYFPVACFVAIDGTDDDTVCNRHEPAKNGLRYCRGCDDFVALHLFPKSTKPGFACKKHVSLHGGGRNAKLKQMSDINKKRRILAWKLCYSDRKIFKQTIIAIRQNEIEIEVLKIDPNPLLGAYAAVPLDCKAIVSPQNIAVVSVMERKKLIKMFKANDFAKYTQTICQIISLQEK
jgi:hypothetical protein